MTGERLQMQTCPVCGRTEAAGAYCTWCVRRMGPADCYSESDPAAKAGGRMARLPTTAPADPPPEFRHVANWPAQWGPCPYAKAPSPAQRPPVAPDGAGLGTDATMAPAGPVGGAGGLWDDI